MCYFYILIFYFFPEKYSGVFGFSNRISEKLLPQRFLPNKGFQNIRKPWRPKPWSRPRPNQGLPNRFASTIVALPPFRPETTTSIVNDYSSTPSSFDDLSLGNTFTGDANEMNVPHRLNKLDSIFRALQVNSEKCKQKIICEVSKNAEKFSPLAEILRHETR